ncbi:hypothetical protein [Streptomyces sp. AS02]|uniref:hypothetical protein n=1 Tax=Streptomyces sp. AS02 TaxID=2938946 RepID=UPI0020227594|nr:hypothetical protein [Streptomyces sp. AS02]MCL8013410.1 hypothetical protein [Streptomyces sp. AS02]
MGNTRAWPVLRTTDLGEALDLAEKLLAVASWYDPTWCHLDAWVHSESELRRLTDAFPDARATSYGSDGARFPVKVSVGIETVAQARDVLATGMAIQRCFVLWHNLKWPPVPELGLDEEYKYAELEVACNSHDIHCEEWAPEHTVFVHGRPGHDARADWLAERVGARVVGPPEFGW